VAPQPAGPSQPGPFYDLPAALLDAILDESAGLTVELLASFHRSREETERAREQLRVAGWLGNDADLGFPPVPTCCGIDGSYAIERMLTTDLAGCAAVAMEGLTPPSETRHWRDPHYRLHIHTEPHHEDTDSVLRALMIGFELLLASEAPHDVVMLDATLTLPIIYLNQGLSKSAATPDLSVSGRFQDLCVQFLEAYLTVLRSPRSDRAYIGLPKYTTRREIGAALDWSARHDDRGMLTLVLHGGEFVRPRVMEAPSSQWHLGVSALPANVHPEASRLAAAIVAALHDLQVFYYRPHAWLPAIRVEMGPGVADNSHRLATVIQALRHQCATPSMLEAYPVYIADRFAKSVARALPACRQVATQRLAEQYDGDVREVFLGMHGYRSEIGR
jgi:hypothetical protein